MFAGAESERRNQTNLRALRRRGRLKPGSGESGVVQESHLALANTRSPADQRKLLLKPLEATNDRSLTRYRRPMSCGVQESSDLLNSQLRIRTMFTDVLSRDIGEERLVPVALVIKDQAGLFPQCAGAELLASKKQPQFEGHVESRQPRFAIEFCSRDVVDAKAAVPNQAIDLVDPNF